MPRKQKTDEEKALEQQVAALIRNIKGDKPGPDVDKAIKLFEKAQASITQALAVLRMEEVVEEVDPNRKKAGRPRKVVGDGELFSTDSATAGEAEEQAASPTAKTKKGAPTQAANA